MTDDAKQQMRPWGFALLAAILALFYALMLNDAFRFRPGGGDAVLSAAFAIIYDVLAVWIALALLLTVAAVKGDMPGAGIICAILLVPASGVATATAIDYASRGGAWALSVPCLLPPLIASYAAWARFSRLRSAAPGGVVTGLVWGTTLIVSALAGYAAA